MTTAIQHSRRFDHEHPQRQPLVHQGLERQGDADLRGSRALRVPIKDRHSLTRIRVLNQNIFLVNDGIRGRFAHLEVNRRFAHARYLEQRSRQQ
jgi:hypothetical protein